MSIYEQKKAFAQTVYEVLSPYKERFEKENKEALEKIASIKPLRDICEYAMTGPGKRFRPALVYMMAEAVNKSADVTPSTLAVEYFHTSSLIADDLPCMDNDDYRRGRLSVHKAYDEPKALLVSYGLIASGFGEIAKNAALLNGIDIKERESICEKAIELASEQMGNNGLIGGQFLDLFPPEITKEVVDEIIRKKTVVLFDLSFSLGWLFSGGAIAKLGKVHDLAYLFGSAFQIVDDLDDYEKDLNEGKRHNYAVAFGKEKAVEAVVQKIDAFLRVLKELQIESKPMQRLATGISSMSQAFVSF